MKTFLHEHEKCFTIVIFILWDLCDDSCLKIYEHESQKILWSKACLIRYNLPGVILPIDGEGNLHVIGLFKTLFDHFVWHAINIQTNPFVTPVELGTGLHLEDITHGWSKRVPG